MKLKSSLSNKIFYIFVSVVSITVGLISWYGYASAKEAYIKSAFEINYQRTENIAFKIQEELAPVIKDVSFLTDSHALGRYMIWKNLRENEKTKKWRQIFSNSLIDFMETKRTYYSFSVLDIAANELISVYHDTKINKANLLIKSELTNRFNSEYYKSTKNLSKGEFYISKLGLSMRNGKIQEPYNPVLIYSTPLINSNNEFIGVFVANIYAKNILDIVESSINEIKDKGVKFYLIDKEKNYIYHKNKSKRWNYQLKNGEKFSKDYFNIKNTKKLNDVFIHDDKIYSYYKVYPSKVHSTDYWYVVSVVDTKVALKKLDEFKFIFYMVLVIVILFSFIIIRILVLKLISPLEKVTYQLKALSRGEIRKENISYKADDEIGWIVESTSKVVDAIEATINQANAVSNGEFSTEIQLLSDKDKLGYAIQSMTKRLSDIAAHADSIANGDFSNKIAVKSEYDKLGKSLLLMNETLKENKLKSDADIWFSQGVTYFSDSLAGLKTINKVFKKALNVMCKYIDATSGVVYTYNENHKQLEYVTSYAYSLNKEHKKINLGDGTIGYAASEKTTMHIKNINDENFIIKSSMGNIIPSQIYVIPILYKDELYGVAEFASVVEFSDLEIRYINRVCEILAIVLNSTSKNMQIKKLLKESEKSYEELQKVSEYKSEFLANMSHELRTPLNSIILLSKLLTKNINNTLDESDISKMSIISKAGTDLLLLINDILDLSKIESGNIVIEDNSIHTQDIIDELKGLFEVIAKDKDIEFIVKDEFNDTFVADSMKLLQIMKNLLSNAFKFTKKGKVSINIKQNQNDILFEVSDTGLGINEKKLSLIFEAFKQVDGSISREYGGTGLGLSISKTFVDLMNGHIEVSSVEGEGSTFSVLLPLKQILENEDVVKEDTDLLPNIKQEDNIDSNALAGKNILIVDDDSRNIFTLSAILQNLGAEVFTSLNGEDALKFLNNETSKVDIILMDVMMPVMDGLEAIKLIRECNICKHVPIIAVTAKITKLDEKMCYEAGADDYLPKPIDNKLLISKIKERSL